MIIVNAKIVPKENKADEIIEKAHDLIAESRTHVGNISYNLYTDVEDGTLMFIEKWETKENLEKHMRTDIFIDFGTNTKELMEGDLEIALYLGDSVE